LGSLSQLIEMDEERYLPEDPGALLSSELDMGQ